MPCRAAKLGIAGRRRETSWPSVPSTLSARPAAPVNAPHAPARRGPSRARSTAVARRRTDSPARGRCRGHGERTIRAWRRFPRLPSAVGSYHPGDAFEQQDHPPPAPPPLLSPSRASAPERSLSLDCAAAPLHAGHRIGSVSIRRPSSGRRRRLAGAPFILAAACAVLAAAAANDSLPLPPSTMSLPPPPLIRSLPLPPQITSAPCPRLCPCHRHDVSPSAAIRLALPRSLRPFPIGGTTETAIGSSKNCPWLITVSAPVTGSILTIPPVPPRLSGSATYSSVVADVDAPRPQTTRPRSPFPSLCFCPPDSPLPPSGR